jgi:hypothetical protein
MVGQTKGKTRNNPRRIERKWRRRQLETVAERRRINGL